MESYEIKKLVDAEAFCACCFEGTSIVACPEMIIYYRETAKALPWFKEADLRPLFIAMNLSFVAILTGSGILILLPLYTLTGEQYVPAWRKFISKTFYTLVSQKSDEGFLDIIGGCMASRDRPYDNYLEVSLLKVRADCFTGMVWSSNLIIMSLKNEFLIINTYTGLLEKKLELKLQIEKLDLMDGSVLIKSGNLYLILTIQDLLQDKIHKAKKAIWEGKVQALPSCGMISLLYKEKLQLFYSDQILSPVASFILPHMHSQCFVWKKCIVAISPGVSVIGKVPFTFSKRINKCLYSPKICACGNCKEKIKVIDYEEWITKDKDSCVLWNSSEDIGKVIVK
jgi:hypothetical protein